MRRRALDAGAGALILIAFVVLAVLLRGVTISNWTWLNPDEAELMAQGRAAVVSPLPYSTWASGTTGPFWVQFLAILALLGLPLTIAFAHLLSAMLAGIIGFFLFVLLRRSLGVPQALIVIALGWLPLVLIYPLGSVGDFGALNTEYLPAALLLGAALISPEALRRRPGLFLVVGLLSGLAVGSKYQILPVAVALVAAQLLVNATPPRRWVAPVLLVAAGAIVPFALTAIAVVLSPGTSDVLLEQNLAFLGSYASGVTLEGRLINSARLIATQPVFLAAMLAIAWLCYLSSRRVAVARLLLVASGIVAVVAGGMGFGHYLIVLYVAVGLAASLPLRAEAVLFPGPRVRGFAFAFSSLMVVALVAVGLGTQRVSLSGPAVVAASLSAESVVTDDDLAQACPTGSDVLVWGWAPELYVNYSWANTIPYLNVLGITGNPDNLEAGEQMVSEALELSDCVVDAVGPPFFAFQAGGSLTAFYPQLAERLERDYRTVDGLIDCESCTVYVRD